MSLWYVTGGRMTEWADIDFGKLQAVVWATDDYEPTDDERLREEAKRVIETPPEPIPGAEGLPDDVRDGRINDDDGSTVTHYEGEPST